MSPPLAMWEKEAQVVELEKGESGLGFSILDYQVRNYKQTNWGKLQFKNMIYQDIHFLYFAGTVFHSVVNRC